jgi:hypothetical protein
MLDRLRAEQLEVAVAYFPENPVFRDAAAASYFDPALSDAYAQLFARETHGRGDRFEDWRQVLEPEDFYDMIHVNLVGRRKLADRFVELIESEWKERPAAQPEGEGARAR